MHKAFLRLLACVLITILWVGASAKVSAQSAYGEAPTSSYERQIEASPSQAKSRSVKIIPDQPPNSFIQYGDV